MLRLSIKPDLLTSFICQNDFSPIVKASSCSSNILTLSKCDSEGCANKIAHSWHKSFFTAPHIVCMYDNMRRYMTIGEMYFICQTNVNVSVFLRAGCGFMGHQATQIKGEFILTICSKPVFHVNRLPLGMETFRAVTWQGTKRQFCIFNNMDKK